MSDKCETFVARWDHAMCSTCGEEHDRPAPTPTTAPGLDLDAVERAERAMTPGEWRADFTYVTAAGIVATCIGPDAEHDAAGIVALRNAAPALIAEVRALRHHCDAAGPDHNLLALLDLYHEREQAALAKLAETKSLLRSAGDVSAERPLVGCVLHDGADIDACGCPALDSPGAIAYRGLLVKARAEIARLTAELAASRAVTAGVCRYLDCAASDLLAVVTSLYETRARAISDATAARGTVGGLLATAPVGAIVEFWHGATANQITTRVGGIDDRVWLWRYRNPNGEWSPWDYEAPSPDDLSQPGEIVPSDPSQRGPLPKGG